MTCQKIIRIKHKYHLGFYCELKIDIVIVSFMKNMS